MRGQPGFFDIDDRLKRLSDLGDQLEAFRSAVDFELFRPELNAALSYTDRTEGGRPPFDPVLMFKNLEIDLAGASLQRPIVTASSGVLPSLAA
jgi:IS5 family transposase